MTRALIAFAVAILPPAGLSAQQVFFGNLHSHTSFSDGSGLPEDAYAHARSVGLDFLAITEHNHAAAEDSLSKGDPRKDGILIGKDHTLYVGPRQDAVIPAANRANADGTFVAIFGQEFSSISKGNHVNVFFVDAVIDAKNGCFGPQGNGCNDGDLVTFLGAHRDFTGALRSRPRAARRHS